MSHTFFFNFNKSKNSNSKKKLLTYPRKKICTMGGKIVNEATRT